MKIDEHVIDWLHPPTGVQPSWEPSGLHDGVLRRIETDARARSAGLWFEVPHFCLRYGQIPEGVLFGLEVSGVTAMRASVSRRFPDDFQRAGPSGETREEMGRRIDAWHALGQEVSIAWDDFERVAHAGGMSFWEGALIQADAGAAPHLIGSYPAVPVLGCARRTVRIVITGAAVRWSRTDGVPWSADAMKDLSNEYWAKAAEVIETRRRKARTGETLERSLPRRTTASRATR